MFTWLQIILSSRQHKWTPLPVKWTLDPWPSCLQGWVCLYFSPFALHFCFISFASASPCTTWTRSTFPHPLLPLESGEKWIHHLLRQTYVLLAELICYVAHVVDQNVTWKDLFSATHLDFKYSSFFSFLSLMHVSFICSFLFLLFSSHTFATWGDEKGVAASTTDLREWEEYKIDERREKESWGGSKMGRRVYILNCSLDWRAYVPKVESSLSLGPLDPSCSFTIDPGFYPIRQSLHWVNCTAWFFLPTPHCESSDSEKRKVTLLSFILELCSVYFILSLPFFYVYQSVHLSCYVLVTYFTSSLFWLFLTIKIH